MTGNYKTRGAWVHFSQRVAERIGPHVDAKQLWDGICRAIDENDEDSVQFVTRISREGRRLWRFRVEGETYFTIFDHSVHCPVTVLQPKGFANRCGGEPINLEDHA